MADVNETEVPLSEESTPGTEVTVPAPAPKPGEKTDPAMLLESLKDEREKRRKDGEKIADLESELTRLREANPENGDVVSDEGKALLKQIDGLKSKLASQEEQERLKNAQLTYPAIKDKAAEFEAFRTDPANKGMSVEVAAKAFVVEFDLMEGKPRKGLETPTGGSRAPQPSGLMTPDEADKLRTTNYREYSRLVREGKIQF